MISHKYAPYILTIFFIGMFSGMLSAEGAGTSGAGGFDQMTSIRACGMAEAYTAVGGEVGSMNYNPAGLATLTSREIAFSYHRGIAEDSGMNMLYGQPTGMGFIGVSFMHYTAGTMDLIDADGFIQNVKAEQDYVLSIGYATDMIPFLPAGITIKGISSTLAEKESAQAYAVDAGLIYHTPWEALNCGISVRNLGTNITYIDDSDPLPLTASFGAAAALPVGNKDKLLVCGDIAYRIYDKLAIPAAGIEYDIHNFFRIRTGYTFSNDVDFGMTIGAGFQIRRYCINYAFIMSDNLDDSHRVSLNLSF